MIASKRLLRLAAVFSVGVLAGCAGATTQSGSRGASSMTLTQAELAKTNSNNLYDAIKKLRPEWLTSRGPTSVTDATPSTVDVYMNGSELGGIDYLREVSTLDVSAVRYWDPGQASARFGMGHPSGVIELIRE